MENTSNTNKNGNNANTVLAPVNYVAIVCKYSNEGKTCGELFNKTENCKKCDWNKQYEYSFSTLSSGWQLCPKCNGDGDLYRYNSPSIMSTNCRPICDVCNGKKIISIDNGLPPL